MGTYVVSLPVVTLSAESRKEAAAKATRLILAGSYLHVVGPDGTSGNANVDVYDVVEFAPTIQVRK